MSREKIKYISYGQSVDGTNYCSGVETLAENFIEDNEDDAVLVYPSKDGWASVSSSAYRITTENTEAIFPLPIYKLKKFLLRVDKNFRYFFSSGSGAWVTPGEGEEEFYVDITKYIVEKEIWEGLRLCKATGNVPYAGGIFKDNTLILNQGEKSLVFTPTVRKIKEHWFDFFFKDKSPTYLRVVYSAYFDTLGEEVKYYHKMFVNDLGGDVREWKFRIEYVPLISKTKMRARKSEKTTVDYVQPHNQRAEINAVSAFGKNMWLEAQKTGTKTVTVVKRYKFLGDIPPVGSTVWHNNRKYVVVANSYKHTNTLFVQVTHTLSENWTSKSKHVSVDQKYRNYSIPQDTLWRNLYWEDYIVAGGAPKTIYDGETSNADDKPVNLAECLYLFNTNKITDRTISTFSWIFDTKDENGDTVIDIGTQGIGVTAPCTTLGTANSMIFSAEFKDQLSAGLRRFLPGEDMEEGEELDTKYICDEALYCNKNGKLRAATVMLTQGNDSYLNEGDSYSAEEVAEYARRLYPIIKGPAPFKDFGLPMCLNYPGGLRYGKDNLLFAKKFYVDKQPGEAIKFTYQIHCVGEDGCVFGNKFCEHNTLVKSYDNNRVLKVWLLSDYIREGADKLENPRGESYLISSQEAQDTYYKITYTVYSRIHLLKLTDFLRGQIVNSGGLVKAWAITDEDNNLYVGRNNDTTGEIYFTLTHKRT